MSQSAEKIGMVNEKLETAINIGCAMVSKSKQIQKKLNSSANDNASLKKSMKELDRMSIEIIDKLFEITARIDLPDGKNSKTSPEKSKFRLLLNRILRSSRKRIENMRVTYQDVYTL